MLLAGLTGNFGMGKSLVLSDFGKLGAITIDSDSIVALLLREPEIVNKIRKIFGPESVDADNKVNKNYIAKIIFNDDRLKRKLEKILHPMVIDKINSFLEEIKDRRCIVVVEVPLLFEKGYEKIFDRVITVYTTKDRAVQRLKKAGFSRLQALERLNVQMPVSLKKNRSDYVIDNNGSRQKTFSQVRRIFGLLAEEIGHNSLLYK